MSLVLRIEGLDHPYPLAFFGLKRKLGAPTEVTVELRLDESKAGWLDDLAARLLQPDATMDVQWNGAPLFDKVAVSVVRSMDSAFLDVLLVGHYTQVSKDAFVPRKRVLKAGDLRELLRTHFSDVVTWENSINSQLGEVKFPDGRKTNHVQAGVTDMEMLRHLLACYNQHSEPEKALLLSGSATESAYQLVWAQDSRYRELTLHAMRTIENDPRNTYVPRLKFGQSTTVAPELTQGNHPALYVSYNMKHGNMEPATWTSWRKKNVPLYYNDNFVYEIEDSLRYFGENKLDWDSYVHVLPRGTMLSVPKPAPCATWCGKGKVSKRDAKNEWAEVVLDDFEQEHNRLDVRIFTPYSGKDQTGGLHLVPEENSEVLVMKAPDWMNPAILLGNIRNQATTTAAPYWQVEDPLTWNFHDVSLESHHLKAKASKEILLRTNGVTAKIDNSEMHIS